MENTEKFRFQSKLLKGKTRGIASLVAMAGGRDCRIDFFELLALSGVSSDAPRADIDEAVGELAAVFAFQKHPFWTLLDDKEDAFIAKVAAELDAKAKEEWNALSLPHKVFKTLIIFVAPLLGLYLLVRFVFLPNAF